MQPEPNEISQKTSLTSSTQDNYQDSKHGFDQPTQRLPSQPLAEERRPEPRRSPSDSASSTSSGVDFDEALEYPLRRLNPPSRPHTRSPVDRVAEHEKASTKPPKRRTEGPAFTIVQRGQKPIYDHSTIADFPNEVLTHILSHLPPASLSDVSLVSKQFHRLVTTPHAWRIAFSRFFPGSEALSGLDDSSESSIAHDTIHTERRLFTRLTALASWRSEYILRTRLLRSIARGKPLDNVGSAPSGASRPNVCGNGSAQTTYNSGLITIVDHLHATFGTGFNKRLPRFIHGATDVGMASSSDPRNGKVDAWGLADAVATQHFADTNLGDAPYGLGAGEVIGVPNVMDVSQCYGMVYAEGTPGGRVYYRSVEEKRGRILASPIHQTTPELGIPSILPTESMCAVWIAKSACVPELSEGLIGMLVGSSQGVLTSYSLGTNSLRERRFERGEVTARWVLSPGIPIIAIAVDDDYSLKRQSMNRIWVVALNALGEIFYLADMPTRPQLDLASRIDDFRLDRLTWATGRTVYWTLVEPTRRVARPDPFGTLEVDGSYTPRSSWNGMGLSPEQITAETQEINSFLQKKPKHFRKVSEGWDMRRRLVVDFAASDENGAGEGVVVINCAQDDGQHAEIKRYTRYKLPDALQASAHGSRSQSPDSAKSNNGHASLFGGAVPIIEAQPRWSFGNTAGSGSSSKFQSELASSTSIFEEWRTSVFLFGGLKSPQITTTAIDMSSFALLTTAEDPLLSMTGSSLNSSPLSTPLAPVAASNSSADVLGQRARLLAVGTKNGTILVWNARAPTAPNTTLENYVKPVRMIYTDSPQISCIALTALYLVHGGNDGLVQAWDPLASSTEPLRTLNSRFSSRARRRLVQAEASAAGVGINLFAAGAIYLDPDPTVLRGMVSLGSRLRYWSYSSQAADQFKGNKRRLRRSERGSNQGGDRYSGTGRGALKDYIANERLELEHEKLTKRKEEERLSGRYGIDLLGPGATEDEILAYATMLSEEAAQGDELRRKSASECSNNSTVIEEHLNPSPLTIPRVELESDMAEAIRLSLEDSNGYPTASLGDSATGSSTFAIKYAKRRSPSSSPPRRGAPRRGAPHASLEINHDVDTATAGLDDLKFALQLSQAEEESRAESGKGKGRAC